MLIGTVDLRMSTALDKENENLPNDYGSTLFSIHDSTTRILRESSIYNSPKWYGHHAQ